MLRDILQAALNAEPDMEVVGESERLNELRDLVRRGAVDVVMLGLADDDLPAPHYQLFDADPRVRILAIGNHGRNVSLYELRPHRMMLGEGSPHDLMRVIRDLVRLRSAPTGPADLVGS